MSNRPCGPSTALCPWFARCARSRPTTVGAGRGRLATVAPVRRGLYEDEHELFRDSVRRFIAAEVAPRNEVWEQAGVVDRDLFTGAGKHGFLGMAAPVEHGGGGTRDFRYNLVIAEEIQRAGVNAAGLGWTLHNDICLPYFLALGRRRAKGPVAARHLLGRAGHRHRHDRAGHRVRPGLDDDDRPAGRRRLRGERVQDLHHQRHQRRPRHHRGQDRPDPAPPRHVAARAGAGHGGLRAGPQPRQDRDARPGHGRAVLHRRARPGGQPPRRGGPGVQLPGHQPAPGAAVDRRPPAWPRPGRRSTRRWPT